ncbi:MAG: MATE family efflux transporter [Planctomycetota bacterium]
MDQTNQVVTQESTPSSIAPVGIGHALAEVIRVALPLMVSTGTFSLVLFADRTLLLWYDGACMSASMAAGNAFWTLICVPVGIVSMTSAIIGQCIGSGQPALVGRLLWQVLWLALLCVPLFAACAWFAPELFAGFGQPTELIGLESTYLRILMCGAIGIVIEAGLSGFFSGTERTYVIMWVSLACGLLNVALDVVLIFGFAALPAMGITGAAIASAVSFWFKALVFAGLLAWPTYEAVYGIRSGRSLDRGLLRKLLFFGLPSGLMYVVEAGAFAFIVLQIGRLGDVALQATTMAINFNMVAFIPLVGVSISASVLVGKHLTESGPKRAKHVVIASLLIAWSYSLVWALAYLGLPDQMLSLYRTSSMSAESLQAMEIARGLLGFVAIYVIFDATQLILAGALRGAGDTWFVLIAGGSVSAIAIAIGFYGEPADQPLRWWWWMVTMWILMLCLAMTARYLQGRWKSMRMV